MPKLIPSLSSCAGRMQAGEKRFARRLESHLDDDYLIWYELPVGKRQRYTDFIVLHPIRGLLFLEVKDWKLDSIKSANRVSFDITTSSGLKTVASPLEQARQCAYQLVNVLERDKQLVAAEGKYKGKLLFPYGYGVVLTSITRKQFVSSGLSELLPEHQIICKDEMTEAVGAEEFQERLWGMFNFNFNKTLTLPQVDRIRYHIFPEIRIKNVQEDIFDSSPDKGIEDLVPDIVQVMDRQQESLARSMGQGHRVIHGVAGSGKTMILGYRCLYLASLLSKPILVLCFNITLAARLRELMVDRGVADKVNVYHFHDWCGQQLKTYHLDNPKSGKGNYFDDLVETVIDAVEKGDIPKAQYGAVMVDEAHDFEKEWMKLVVGMVDPELDSLLVLYDDAQSIYKKKSLSYSLSSAGINARGRTTILKMNYRNTDEILQFAYDFAKYYIAPHDTDDDHVPLVEPDGVGRHGPKPVLKFFDSYPEEARYIAKVLRVLHDQRGMEYSDICVLYRSKWMGEQLYEEIKSSGIPCKNYATSVDKRSFNVSSNEVKIMTMHSSKGLEFPYVIISGVGGMPVSGVDASSDAKLLYVAMTRSTEKLLLLSHKSNSFIEKLVDIDSIEKM